MKTLTAVALVAYLLCLPLQAADPPPPGVPLVDALRAGDSAAVQKLLKDGADPDRRNDAGDTPLMTAALCADARAMELLLKAGADVNAANKVGATALLRGATYEDVVRLLVANGADVKARSRMGNTPLILAARKPGNSRTLKLLLDRGAEVNAANAFGATALMAAAAAQDLESVRLLLDHGAEANARPNMDVNGFLWGGGRTPLMWAAFYGNEPLVKLLLERGAAVDGFTVAGSALGQAGWGGHAGVARLLLDVGANVDRRDFIANYTPLHWAASSERASPALVELLLTRGAAPNSEGGQTVDNYLGVPQTPLSLARRRGETAIVSALRKAVDRDAQPAIPRESVDARTTVTAGTRSAAEAVQRALPPLVKTAEDSVRAFLRHATRQDCVSCHQQLAVMPALSLADSRHFPTDREAMRHQVELMQRSFTTGHVRQGDEQHTLLEIGLQATFHPEPAIGDGYLALAHRLEREPASAGTDSMIHHLATIQHADGHWSWNLPRPPLQASDVAATALAVETIKSYGIPARRKELKACVDRARSWLEAVKAETNDERVHQILGLAWCGAEPGELKARSEELMREQRADGGWGQLAGLDSDAYATGQSLYALMEGGKIAADHPAVRRGVDFLLRTQLIDGTWHVRTRAHPFQPPMDSGFPHGRDGWISAAATSWAVMALATSLDPSQAPPTPLVKAVIPTPAGNAEVDASAAPVDFVRDVKPLLERSCAACHSGQRPKGGFRVTDRAALLKGGHRGEAAVVPGKPEASPLLRAVEERVEDLEMPPVARRADFPALTKDEIAKLRGWIRQGANWPDGATLRAPGQ